MVGIEASSAYTLFNKDAGDRHGNIHRIVLGDTSVSERTEMNLVVGLILAYINRLGERK